MTRLDPNESPPFTVYDPEPIDGDRLLGRFGLLINGLNLPRMKLYRRPDNTLFVSASHRHDSGKCVKDVIVVDRDLAAAIVSEVVGRLALIPPRACVALRVTDAQRHTSGTGSATATVTVANDARRDTLLHG